MMTFAIFITIVDVIVSIFVIAQQKSCTNCVTRELNLLMTKKVVLIALAINIVFLLFMRKWIMLIGIAILMFSMVFPMLSKQHYKDSRNVTRGGLRVASKTASAAGAAAGTYFGGPAGTAAGLAAGKAVGSVADAAADTMTDASDLDVSKIDTKQLENVATVATGGIPTSANPAIDTTSAGSMNPAIAAAIAKKNSKQTSKQKETIIDVPSREVAQHFDTSNCEALFRKFWGERGYEIQDLTKQQLLNLTLKNGSQEHRSQLKAQGYSDEETALLMLGLR